MAGLLSFHMTLVDAQDRGRLSSNPTISGVSSQPERKGNKTQNAQRARLGKPARVGHAIEEDDTYEEFKNSPSLKWMAGRLGVSTALAYRLSVTLNFAALVTLIVIQLRSKLPAIFRQRTELIRRALDDAERASVEAKERLSGIELRLAKIGSEIMAIQSTADQQWRAEEQRIHVATAEATRRIAEMAEKEIAVAVDRARHELKAHTAGLAVSLAATRIQVDNSTDQALVRDFISQLGQNGQS
jgi:F-type H+-transporting ATPase subunit b